MLGSNPVLEQSSDRPGSSLLLSKAAVKRRIVPPLSYLPAVIAV
jgi:hypothetical protein